MKTTPENTLHGLKTYFFDSVFSAHRKDYPANMTREQFAERLDAYREGMNTHNGCNFPEPAASTVAAWYNEYIKEAAQ